MANTANVVNQHLTPKFYLKGFAFPAHSAFIWQYHRGRVFSPGESRDRSNPVKMSLRKAGAIPNYYPGIEDELTAIEVAAKPIIEKIRRATVDTAAPLITPAEKHAFVDYIGNLHKRVTNREKRVKPLWEKVVGEFPWDEIQRELANRGRFADAQKLGEFRESYTQTMPEPVRQQSILIPYDLVAKKLQAMTWRFLVASAPDAFVTSDDPVYLGSTSIFVPLASHVAMLAQMSGPDDCIVHPIDAARVEQCNRVTIRQADQHLYSHQPNEWVADTFNNPPP